jgi:hypothetical protein
MALRIEIAPIFIKGLWRLRIGDLTGACELYHISKEEVLKEISDQMDDYYKNNEE